MADALSRLLRLLRELPGVGEKTATRHALYILTASREYGRSLARSLIEVMDTIRPCSVCKNLTEQDPCPVCTDPKRDRQLLCVVEKIPDLLAIEASHEYRGLYHVLDGCLNPLEGKGPEQIGIEKLLLRLPGGFSEIILATSANVEGEATALYLKSRVAPFGLRMTRIASGVPVGGELEYVDRSTLGKAFAGRREIA